MSRRRAVAVALFGLLLAGARGEAQTPAEPAFFGGLSNGTFTNLWSTNGSPTLVYDASQWWVQINPATNATEYIETPIASGTQTHTLHLGLKFTALPSSGEQQLATICAGSSCAKPQAILAVDTDTSRNPDVSKLKLYFKDRGNECTSNSLFKYSACTTQADCPSDVGGNPGEADCAPSVFVVSEGLELATPYSVAIVSSSDTAGSRPHDVTVSLYKDGQLRGGKTRWQGTCTGGSASVNGKACGATADCTYICSNVTAITGDACSSAGTCTGSSTIGDVTSIRLGADTANLPAMDAQITDDVLTLSATDTYARYAKVVTLYPSGNGTNNWTDAGSIACTNHDDCVDDTEAGGAIDNDATTSDAGTVLQDSSNADEIWTLTDYAPAGGETVVAATARAAGKETSNNANTTKNLIVGLRDTGSNETLGSAVDLASFNDDSNYRLIAGPITQTHPGGGALTLNNLRGLVRKSGGTGSGFRLRVTDYVAEAVVAKPVPAVTDLLPERNGDSKKTLCIGGDSIMNDAGLFEMLNGLLPEPSGILRCAEGGQMIGDFAGDWSRILDGNAAANIPCYPERGENAHCDVFILHVGANNFARVTQQIDDNGTCFQRGCVGGANDGLACTTTAADCPGGTCTDYSGPQNGGGCDIATGVTSDAAAPYGAFNARSHCLAGDAVGTDCTFGGIATCGGPGGCLGGANVNKLCTKANEGTDCPGSTCGAWGGWGAHDQTDSEATYGYTYGRCQRGAAGGSDCLKGTCARATTTAYMAQTLDAMAQAAKARTGSSAVTLVLAGNTMPYAGTPKMCVAGSGHQKPCSSPSTCTPCTTNADCPTPGRCKVVGAMNWEAGRAHFEWFGKWLRAYAKTAGLRFLDLGTYQTRTALNGGLGPNAYLRDFIHQNDLGHEEMATLIAACALRDSSIEQNECEDLQSATVPTALYALSSATGPNGATFKAQTVGAAPAAAQVNSIALHIASVPSPTANIKASVYTLSAGTFTKLSTSCDTAATPVTATGWMVLPVTTPTGCLLSAGTTYYAAMESDTSALLLTISADAPQYFGKVDTYAAAMPATASGTIGGGLGFPWYLRVQ